MTKAVTSKKKTSFAFAAPDSTVVELVGDFTHWQANPVKLKKQKTGVWKANVELAPGNYRYRFVVDGQWRDDPECTLRVANPYGGEDSVRVVD